MQSSLATNLIALTRCFGMAPALPEAATLAAAMPARIEIGIGSAWLERLVPDPPPDVICGIGLCRDLMVDALLDAAPASRVVLLEPNAADARRALERRPWQNRIDAGRLALLVGPDYAGLAGVARIIPGLGSAPVIVHPALNGHPDLVGRARDALARLVFQHDANAAARRALSGRYLLHSLVNAPTIAREGDAARLRQTFAGRPAVIAAAGPSLDRNLQDLAAVVDRALLIACDTAAWPILSSGITPHLVVAVDASEANARHLSSFPGGRTWLAAEASVHPTAVAPFAGRTFFFRVSDHEPWPWFASLGLGRGQVAAWGSVATTALALALEMGCDPIVFVGADFAFTGDRPYCRGTSFEATWASWARGGQPYDEIWRHLLARWPTVEMPSVTGAPVRTAPHLVAFRDWIVERATERTDRRFVNATGAGLLAGGPIRQQSACATLGRLPAIPAETIARDLRTAHAAGTTPGVLTPLFAAATAVVAGADEGLVQRWRTFTDDTVSRDAIRAALASREQQAWALGASAYRRLMEASA
jgi:hypothetical protein